MTGISDILKNYADYTGALPHRSQTIDEWRSQADICKTLAAHQTIDMQTVERGSKNPLASYQLLSFNSTDGERLFARYVAPKTDERVPTVVMFHDDLRGARGWFHLTRFIALGYAVVHLENRIWSRDITHIIEGRPEFAQLIDDALMTTAIALELPQTDTKHICLWGEGLGAALALDVAASMTDVIDRLALQNPLPADLKLSWERSRSDSLYFGLMHYSREIDPVCEHLNDLFDHLQCIDTVNFAPGVLCPVLFGMGLADTVALPETQFAVFNSISSTDKRLVSYPKWGHERINDFEDEILKFFNRQQ